MATGLNIKVTADVKQATNALANEVPNAVNKTNNSFGGLSNAIKGKLSSALSGLGNILGGIGQGFEGLIGAITPMTAVLGVATIALKGVWDALISTKNQLSKGEIAVANFSEEIRKASEAITDLKNQMNFESQIRNLSFQLQGFKGGALKIATSASDFKANIEGIVEIDKQIKKLTGSNKELEKTILSTVSLSKKLGGKNKFIDAINKFGLANVPKQFREKSDNTIVGVYYKQNEELKKLAKERLKLIQQNALNILKVGLGVKEQTDEILKKDAAVAKIIKPISKKTLPSLSSFLPGKVSVQDIEIPPDVAKAAGLSFSQLFYSEIQKYSGSGGLSIEFENIFKKENQEREIANMFGVGANDFFTDIQKSSIAAANAITSTLTPAFTGLFDAIVAGENPLKAFFSSLGNAIKQLIERLISAAVTALALSFIFPGGLAVNGGAKIAGFGSFFKSILGFADGGLVTGPQLALIGEGSGTSKSNPEVVAPLDKLKGMLAGLGGGSQVVVLDTIIRGNNLALVQARTSRSQRRTTGR